MTMSSSERLRGRLTAVAAILVGLVVPSLFAGRVPMGVALGLAFAGLAGAGLRPTAAPLRTAARSPLGIAVAATFTLWLVSAATSMKPGWSLLIWGQTVGLLFVALLLHAWLRADGDARVAMLKSLVASAVFGAVVAVTAMHVWPEALAPFRTRSIASFYEATQALRAYGSVVPVLTPAVLLAGMSLGGAWRLAALAYLPLGLAVVHGTGSAAGLLGYGALVAALAVAWLMIELRQRPARLLAAALTVAAFAAVGVLVTHLPSPPYHCETLALPTWLIDPHRQVIWGFALDRAAEYPLLGFGIDVGGSLPGAKVPLPECIGQNYLPSHAHDWMLEMLVETGGLGLAAAVGSLLLWARGLIQLAARRHRGAIAAVGVAGAFFGSGLVNFSIWAAWWQTTFFVLAAVTLAVTGPARGRGAA